MPDSKISIVASLVAAIASVWNAWRSHRDKAEKIKVSCGLIDPQISPGYFLHVINLCDYPIRIVDYGYVMERGELLSLPRLEADEPDSECITYGSRLLENRSSSFETGTTLRDRPIGVYANIPSRSKPTIAFQDEIPKWSRYWLRIKIWCRPTYQI